MTSSFNIIATQKYRMVNGIYVSPSRQNLYPPNYGAIMTPPTPSDLTYPSASTYPSNTTYPKVTP